jgi:hypothetical protein
MELPRSASSATVIVWPMLSDITDNRFNFFGLEVELWRIADSPIAPKFNVVSKPNDWTKDVARGASQVGKSDLTDRQQLQLDFWTRFREYAETRAVRIKTTKPFPQHWMNIAVGRTGFHLCGIASLYDSVAKSYDGHELRTELWIDNDDSKVYFAILENMKADIEKDLGGDLTWHNLPDKRSCRIYVRHPVDLNDRSRWGEYHEWLLNNLETFHKTFAPIVKRLDADEYDAQQSGASE